MTAADRTERLVTGLDDSVLFVDDAVIDEEILAAERNAALRAAFAELPPRCQQLLSVGQHYTHPGYPPVDDRVITRCITRSGHDSMGTDDAR